MFRLFRDREGASLAPQGSVACIGAFDGVHRGHRALLARVRERADELGLAALALSFEPIPREYFARGEAVPRIDDARGKIANLAATGIDRLLLLRFNAALASMEADDFIRRVLVARCTVREVWIGADFRFGRGRAGDIALLEAHAAGSGFATRVFGDFTVDGERVRSSTIRTRLAAGDFDGAADLLGRRFMIGGHVVHGLALGRKLGYPTANIPLGRRTSPVAGIFAVRVHGVGAAPMPGVASLGIRPTIDGTEPLLEAHLFDFDGDLYGRRIDVEFVAKLRDELKFGDLDAMVRQIDADARAARHLLGLPEPAPAGALA